MLSSAMCNYVPTIINVSECQESFWVGCSKSYKRNERIYFSNEGNVYKLISYTETDSLNDSENFLDNIETHIDYEKYSAAAGYVANLICNSLFTTKKIKPNRIANSVEGGIAIVYTKKCGLLKKTYRELFIEIYNDNSIAYAYTQNYKLKDSGDFSFENISTVSKHFIKILEERNFLSTKN